MAAVMENRAHEVGIATLTLDLNILTTTQLIDTTSYHHTRNFLNSFEVSNILFSQSLVGSPLHQLLTEYA